MLRVEGSSFWTADQHEAAAAALGEVAAMLMRVSSYGSSGNPAMDVQACLDAKWIAQDAASYALAATIERDKMAAALDRELPIVTVCAWCGAVPESAKGIELSTVRVSHGCCPSCLVRLETSQEA